MALAERIAMGKDGDENRRDADVVLGDDWVAPDSTVEKEMRATRAQRGLFTLNRSPLTRKIITFNLIALNVLVAGVLWLNSSRDTLAIQRINALQSEVELLAEVFESQLQPGAAPLGSAQGVDVAAILQGVDLREGTQVMVFDSATFLVGETEGKMPAAIPLRAEEEKPTVISDFLNGAWQGVAGLFSYFSGIMEQTHQIWLHHHQKVFHYTKLLDSRNISNPFPTCPQLSHKPLNRFNKWTQILA
ncbi:sensor N-terminal transmembrane domain-containing protein [Sagittula stellata]|uniref:Sensor histidine kinase ChvG n=1 Tax=Sagittula stellata (strain ATCC 700073 / DSM 11524 / E-37) TaxID=388399 RepID=A3JX63_SAGS3|nr:sensor N-terminal transmembrane domain-containing protein [Sagittula stellata]EBA10099.1 sensor histidine kinase ChvG [Sagittula stellata E-37]